MLEYKLQYRGKKSPFSTPPIINPSFEFGEDPVWIPVDAAEALMKINPKMFHKLGQRDIENPIEDAADIKPKPELDVPEIKYDDEDLTCKKCGKKYTPRARRHYLKHIKTCTGPNDD